MRFTTDFNNSEKKKKLQCKNKVCSYIKVAWLDVFVKHNLRFWPIKDFWAV
jgi:hypothetical protein